MIDRFEVKNHSIYVWGGNGESYPTVKAVAAGYEKQLKAFDCSELAALA